MNPVRLAPAASILSQFDDRAAQVTQAMFGMAKFDIAALEKAYSGD